MVRSLLFVSLSFFLFSASAFGDAQCRILADDGGLTVEEVRQIQKIVDEFGHPIVVVGPAADGTREKGDEIDYILPVAKMSDFANALDWKLAKQELLKGLPQIKINASLGAHKPNEMHNRIWFLPHQLHRFTRVADRNLRIPVWPENPDTARLNNYDEEF